MNKLYVDISNLEVFIDLWLNISEASHTDKGLSGVDRTINKPIHNFLLHMPDWRGYNNPWVGEDL